MEVGGNSVSVTSNMTSTPNYPHFPLLMDSNEDEFQYNESHLDLASLSPSGQTEVVGFENSSFSVNSSLKLQELGFGIPNTELANRIVHYSFGIVLTLIGIAGATGNLLVLYVFTRYRRLRGGGVPLILSLATGDCLMSILHIMPAYSSFRETWSFGELGCEIYAASVGLCGLGSLLTLSVIAAERFSVIMGSPATCLSSKKACALIWVFSFGLTFPPLVGWSKYVHEGMSTSCSWDYMSRDWRNRLYYIFLLTFGFIIPVSIIIISYLGILHVVCKQSSQMDGICRNGGMSKKGPTRSELRTAQVVLSIITCYLISWTPYAVCTMIGQFGDASLLSPLSTALPAIFAKASVIYNPFVYGLSHPLFRTAIAALKAQYLGKDNPSGIPLNPRQYCHRYHYTKKCDGGGSSTNNNRKVQLVVKARGNGHTTTSTYDSPRRTLDSPKIIQFDGFRGKIPQHLLRHFTGANIPQGKNNSLAQHSTATTPKFKDVTNERANLSSTSSPSTSFRTHRNHKKQTRYRKKGVWIFKQPLGQMSDSDATGRTTAAVTGNWSSVGDGASYLEESLESETDLPSPVRSALASDKRKIKNRGEVDMSVKNSHTFFLCNYRKRRQEIIEKAFFQSENCLIHDLRMLEKDEKRKELERDGLELKKRKNLEEREKIRALHKHFMSASNDKLLHQFYSSENDQLPEKLEETTLLPAHIRKGKHKNQTIKRVLDIDGYRVIPPGVGPQDIDTPTELKPNNAPSFGNRFSWAGSCSNAESDPLLKNLNLASSAFIYPSGSSKVKQHGISILSRIQRKSIAGEKHRKRRSTLCGSIPLLKSCLSMGDMEKVGGSVTQHKTTNLEQKATGFRDRMPKSISLHGGLKLSARNATTAVQGCGKSCEDCCCNDDEGNTFPYICSGNLFQLIPEVSGPPPSPERNLRGLSRKRNRLSSSSPEIYSESRSRKNNNNTILIEQCGNELALLVDYDEVDIASSRCSESCYESCKSDLCSPSLEGEDLFWEENNV